MAYDPFVNANPLVGALNQQTSKAAQIRENSTRLATCSTRWTTVGSGSKVIEDVFAFDCVFIEEPAFGSGFSISEDSTNDLDTSSVPSVSTGVYRWNKNPRGFYIGAWVFFKVTSTVSYTLNHYLSFDGLAIKDLPTYALDD